MVVKSSPMIFGQLIISLFDCIEVVPVDAELKCVFRDPDSPLLLLFVSLEHYLNSSASSTSVRSTICTPFPSNIECKPMNKINDTEIYYGKLTDIAVQKICKTLLNLFINFGFVFRV